MQSPLALQVSGHMLIRLCSLCSHSNLVDLFYLGWELTLSSPARCSSNLSRMPLRLQDGMGLFLEINGGFFFRTCFTVSCFNCIRSKGRRKDNDALRVFLRVVARVGVGDLGSRLPSLPIGLSLPHLIGLVI